MDLNYYSILARLAVASLMFCCMGIEALAQKISIYNSQPVQVGARNMSLGDATVAEFDDVSTMYTNPAALAYIRSTSVLLNHSEDRTIHSNVENVSIPLTLGTREAISFGASVRHVGYLGQSKNDEFKVLEYGYDVAFGTEIFKATSIGGGLKVRYGNSDVSKLLSVTGIVGMFYAPTPGVNYGVVLKNIGNGITYSSDQVVTSLTTQSLPGALEAGLSLHWPTFLRPVNFSMAISNEKIFKQTGVIYKAGAEIAAFHLYTLRGGYVFDSGPKKGSARFGIGVRFHGFGCDYGISPDNHSEELYRVTIFLGS